MLFFLFFFVFFVCVCVCVNERDFTLADVSQDSVSANPV